MILIISSTKKKAQAISDIFYYMGVLSYAATPSEALSEISSLYRALIILDPEELADAEDYLSRIRSYSSKIPIFTLSDGKDSLHNSFDGVFENSIYSSTLIERIAYYQKQHALPLSAHYRLAGIDASCYLKHVKAFDDLIGFTKTETMILRYLIASYPIPQSSSEIIKYSFKPSRRPELTSIRTHISVMNKKFREVRGRNLFLSIPGEGYVVATPEKMKEIRLAEQLAQAAN